MRVNVLTASHDRLPNEGEAMERPMTDLIMWMAAFTFGTCLTVLSAGSENYSLHLAVTAIVSLGIAIAAVRAQRREAGGTGSRAALAASTARYVGLVWIWAASALLVTYEVLLTWRESWTFVIGLAIVGAVCLLLAILFDRDAKTKKEDASILGLARTLNVLQVVGMLIAVIGLIADSKFGPSAVGTARPDWAANNIFFFGAIAVALIGAHALKLDQSLQRTKT